MMLVPFDPAPETIAAATALMRAAKLRGGEVDAATLAEVDRIVAAGEQAAAADLVVDPEPPRPSDITFELLREAQESRQAYRSRRAQAKREAQASATEPAKRRRGSRREQIRAVVSELLAGGERSPAAIVSRLVAEGLMSRSNAGTRKRVGDLMRKLGVEPEFAPRVHPCGTGLQSSRPRSLWEPFYEPDYDGPRERLAKPLIRELRSIAEAQPTTEPEA